ncbi:metallophosphoesterase [bacterium]|nr:metallophosphoesterase [bacterium]
MLKKFLDNLSVVILAGVLFLIFNAFSFTSANELTFAQISDAHYSPDKNNTSYRLNAESAKLLEDAISQVNETPSINFVIFTGDMINKSRKDDLFQFIEIANKLNKPWYAVFGNHDINIGGYLTKSKYSEILAEKNPTLKEIQKPYYSFSPKKGFKAIILDTIIDTRITANGEIDSEQLKWLDKELEKSKKDVVLIFTHVPIVEPFSSSGHKLLNDDKVLAVLEKYKNPIAVFSGHYHTTKIIPKDNLLFVSTPSLVSYPNAFRIIKVTNNRNYVVFDIKFKETNLKDIQQIAKMMVFSKDLYYGKENDRNFTYKIQK